MPDERLDWNEENLTTVLADLYQAAEADEGLYQRLLSSPFDVLNERIEVPEAYRGGIFAREKGMKVMMLYPPARDVTRQALPEGTTEAEPQKDFDPICTEITIW